MCTATDHWFDQMINEQRMATDAVRFRLEQLLFTAVIHDRRELWHFETSIMSDDLTDDQASDLMRALHDRQRRIPDMYAPSQSDVAKWIRSFCFT